MLKKGDNLGLSESIVPGEIQMDRTYEVKKTSDIRSVKNRPSGGQMGGGRKKKKGGAGGSGEATNQGRDNFFMPQRWRAVL